MDVFEAIYKRRDVRRFVDRPLPREILLKILDAAHHAGSVGFMQPWNFVIIESAQTKQKIYDSFVRCNERAQELYQGPRRELYRSLKLEGIREAPINIAITCDPHRGGPHVLGRQTMPEMDVYSTCCAIQNLWLAARAEGVGCGWVSIIEPEEIKGILKIPASVTLVGYFCLGYPEVFLDRPWLESVGWRQRLPLRDVIFSESWGQPPTQL